MGLLDDKVVLVTGGARGQGRAHAVASAAAGADVALVDITRQIESVPYPLASEDDLEQTVHLVEDLGRRAISFRADVRDQAALDHAVSRTIETFGHIDCVVANAGIWSLAPFWEISDEQWDDIISTCLTGVWRTAKAVAPHMIERGRGSMVLISSVSALEGFDGAAAYVSAKHGVLGLMRNIALELGGHGIRCNAICPGAVDTPMVDNEAMRQRVVGRDREGYEELVQSTFRYHLLRGHSLLPPELIADAALFLNSDLASAVTGVVLPVDSGHHILPGFNHRPTTERAHDPSRQ